MRKIGEFLLARSGHAALVAFLLTLSPLIGVPLGFLASIIVGFVTLSRGPRAGLFVLIWVALPAIAMLYLRRFGVLDLVLLRCVLVWLLAYALRRLGTWRSVFEVAMLLGVLAVVGIHFVKPDIHVWWITHLTKYLDDVSSVTSWRLTATQSDHLIKAVAPMASGIAAFVVLFGAWLMLFLARWWQTYLHYPGRLGEEFIGVRNRIYIAIIVLFGFVGYLLKQPIVIDVFPVLLFPVMMGGLSFLHYVAAAKKGFVIIVVLAYLGLLFLPFVIVVLLALIGFFDTCINFRGFFKIKGDVT